MGGASTITQQVAKNMLVGADRTMMRKVREAILAIRIEEALPKERILELYLNEIFLGYQAYGVAAAAQAYFNKGLDELTVAETGFLGALPKAPNNYNPLRYPDAARARRDWVLDRMAEDGAITAEEAAAAKREPIVARLLRRPEVVQVGQHFTEEVRRELINRFGPEQTTMGGLVVRTSIEPPLQAATEQALRERAARLRPPARRLARAGGAGLGRGGGLDAAAGGGAAPRRHAAGMAAGRGARGARPRGEARLGRAARSARAEPAAHREPRDGRHRLEPEGPAGEPLRADAADAGRAGGRRRRAGGGAARRGRPAGTPGAAADPADRGRHRRARPEQRPGAGHGRRLVLRAKASSTARPRRSASPAPPSSPSSTCRRWRPECRPTSASSTGRSRSMTPQGSGARRTTTRAASTAMSRSAPRCRSR